MQRNASRTLKSGIVGDKRKQSSYSQVKQKSSLQNYMWTFDGFKQILYNYWNR